MWGRPSGNAAAAQEDEFEPGRFIYSSHLEPIVHLPGGHISLRRHYATFDDYSARSSAF